MLHVRAQFCFKNGKFEEASRIYQVLATHNEQNLDNETELACNERAAVSSTPSSIYEKELVTKLNEDSYDLLFNESLIALARNDADLSLNLLNKASSLAKQEGTKDDRQTIQLQTAYVLQVLGQRKEAKEILQILLNESEAGSRFYLLALSNLKSFQDISKYSTNIPLLLRELNVSKLTGALGSLGLEQQETILNNILFLNLFNNSSIQAKSSLLSRTLSNYQKVVKDVVLEPYSTQAKKMFHHTMSAISCGTEGSVIGSLVLTVQLQVLEKEWDRAVKVCEAFLEKTSGSLTWAARVVCYLLFQLYQESNKLTASNALLEKLYNLNSDTEIKEDPEFWRFIAFNLLAQGFNEKAEEVFSKLQKYVPELPLYRFDSSQQDTLSPQLEGPVESVDIENIKGLGTAPFESKKAHSTQSSIAKVSKKRRVHKNKKSFKNYDPEYVANPERWLPLKDRSDFRLKKKSAAKQTQGSAISRKNEQSLDISKKKQKRKARK